MSEERLRAIMEQQQLELKQIMESFQVGQLAAVAAVGEYPEIGSIAIRLPNFWVANPGLWFAHTEANFDSRSPKITTEASKYNYALQALPQDVLAELEHVIESISNEKYTLLKRALLKAYGKSTAKKNAATHSLPLMQSPPLTAPWRLKPSTVRTSQQNNRTVAANKLSCCLLYTSPSPRDS